MKILYVTTISNTVNAFLIPHIKLLVEQGHQVDVAFNIEREVNQDLINLGCKIHKVEFQRSPLKKGNFIAYRRIKRIIKNERYDLVHTHTPVASAFVRLACRKIGNIKIIYTAHGFHFFKGAPFKNWLLYYPIEKYLARYTDLLITINKEDYNRSKKYFKVGSVEYIPGVGIDTQRFNEVDINKSTKRRDLGIPEDAFVILSVGELNKNKNHEVIIKALEKLGNNNIYYIICGKGPLDVHLRDLAKKLQIEKQVILLGYRNDIDEILSISDIFVFPSFREGLPASLMEAMSIGLPIVCSEIRGNSDLVENKCGGFLVNPKDIDGFCNSIEKLYESVELRIKFRNYNFEKIHKYSLENVMNLMERLYINMFSGKP